MKGSTPGSELEKILEEARADRKKKRRRLVAGGVALGLVALGSLSLGGGGEPPLRFETREVVRGDLEVTITATGKVQGVNTVEIGAEVSGRVIEVLVDHNSEVKAGQLLARIDPEQFEASAEEAGARLLVAEATASQAEASLEEAEANLQRAEAQKEEGLIARQDYEAIRAAALRARAQLASARA